MSTLDVTTGQSFTVLGSDTIEVNGVRYTDVTSITYPDGTVKTCSQILAEAGGNVYSPNELRRCVKVELYDPDAQGRQVATMYSNNSAKAPKNEVTAIPGGAWVEMFDMMGDKDSNHVLKLWYDWFSSIGADYTTQYSDGWIGFKIIYGTSAAHSYVVTNVNDFLEESMPSPPSDIGVTHMHMAKLAGKFRPLSTITGGGINHYYVPIRFLRLYRSTADSQGGAIYKRVPVEPVSVAPNAVGGAFPQAATNPASQYGYEITDNVEVDELLDPLATVDLEPPNPRQMLNLVSWRNGMMAAFWDNTVMFCEPFRPYAWPYKIPLPRKVLALVADENSLIAITDGEPFIFMGAHPSNISYEPLQTIQGGIPPAPNPGGFVDRSRGVTKTPAGIIYASREGPMIITGGRARGLGRELFTREDWLAAFGFDLSYLRLSYADGRLVMWFHNVLSTGCQINLDGSGDFSYWAIEAYYFGAQVLPHDDSLYLLTSPNGSAPGQLRRWSDEAASRLGCSYWTRDVLLPKPGNMGVLQVIGYGGNLTAIVWGDGIAVGSFTVDLSAGIENRSTVVNTRLVANSKCRRYSVQLVLGANTVVREATLAGAPAELASA